jgi:hypothetical protein
MATLRNLAIGLIRQAGYNKIAATIRRIKYDIPLLLTILGLQNPHYQHKLLCGDTLVWSSAGLCSTGQSSICPSSSYCPPQEVHAST